MKHYILSFLDRWRWIYFALILAATSIYTLGLANRAPVFIAPLAFYMGTVLLSFDLLRGAGKVAFILPMTRQQVGLAWWSIATWIPVAMNLAAKLLSVWIASMLTGRLVLPSFESILFLTLVDFLYANVVYFVFSRMATVNTADPRNIKAGIYGGAYGLLISGWILIMKRIPISFNEMDTGSLVLVIIASILTVRSFVSAESDVCNRATQRLQKENSQGFRPVELSSKREGGLPGKLETFFNSFRSGMIAGLIMVIALEVLIPLSQGRLNDAKTITSIQGITNPAYWNAFIIAMIALNIQWLGSLRALRTLPLTSSGCTLFLIAQQAAVVTGFSVAPIGYEVLFRHNFAALGQAIPVLLAFIGLVTFVSGIWLNMRNDKIAWLMLFIMPGLFVFAAFFLQSQSLPISMLQLGLISLLPISYIIIRKAITESSNAYRRSRFPSALTGGAGRDW